jgi:hypothetical protein
MKIRCFYGRTTEHPGQEEPDASVSFGVYEEDEATLREAWGIPDDERVRVSGRGAVDGLWVFPNKEGRFMGPQKTCGHKFIGQFSEANLSRFRKMPLGTQTDREGELTSEDLFIPYPDKMKPPRRRQGGEEKPEKRPKKQATPPPPVPEIPTTTILMDLPGKQLSFNVPVGEAVAAALSWNQYQE